MATAIPAIACLGVIGRNNNPLHTTILPTTTDPQTGRLAPLRTPLQFSLLLSSTLDIFESRARHAVASNTLLSGDFGLLHAVDDRLAAYGFETNTGIKFVAVVDMRGRILSKSGAGGGVGSPGGSVGGAGTGGAAASGTGPSSVVGAVGLRDGELKVVFRAMQTAYVRLLQNPFYDPEEGAKAGQLQQKRITSRRFAEEMRRIGDKWVPGGVNTL
ncbi:Longin-like domain-containing protein [Apiospora marii]|uniref:Longin-like domain-containing protein n=1 Tax=Apiospora marii TaxID=335849 RepID=UPI00312D3994